VESGPPPPPGPITAWYATNGPFLVELTTDAGTLDGAIATYTSDLASHLGRNRHKQLTSDLKAIANDAAVLTSDVEQAQRIVPIPNRTLQATWSSALADLGQATNAVKDTRELSSVQTTVAQCTTELQTVILTLVFASNLNL